MSRILEKYKSLPPIVKASGWYMACNIIQNALGFITLPVFTRILTTDEYGLFTIYNTWLNIIVIFTTLNLQYGVFNTAMIKFENDRDRFISSMQGLTTVISVIWLLIYITLRNLWNSAFNLPTILMIAMALEMCFLPAKDYWCGKQKFEYQYKGMVIYTLALTIMNPVISICAVLMADNGGIARILAAAAVNVCFYFVIYIYNFKKGKVFFDKEYWKYAIKFGVPLIIYYLSQIIFNQSDKIMIERLAGRDKAGIYNLVFSCSLVAVIIINSVNSAFVPWKYRKMKEKKYTDIGNISGILSLFIGIILLMVILCGPEIIMLLATEEYYEAIWIMPPIIGSLYFLFQAQLFINIEFYFEEKNYLAAGSVLSAVLNVGLNYITIQKWGYLAAGYMTLVAYIVFALCNYICMRKVCKDKIHGASIYNDKKLLIISIVFLACVFGAVFIYDKVFLRWGIFFFSFIIIGVNAKRLIRWIKEILGNEEVG